MMYEGLKGFSNILLSKSWIPNSGHVTSAFVQAEFRNKISFN